VKTGGARPNGCAHHPAASKIGTISTPSTSDDDAIGPGVTEPRIVLADPGPVAPAAGEALPRLPPVPVPEAGRRLHGRAADAATEHPEAMAQLVTSMLGIHPPRWTVEQFAAKTEVPAPILLRMRRSLGFPDLPSGEAAFSEDDLAIVEVIKTAIDAGAIDLERQLALNRVLGSSMARVSSAAVAAFVEALTVEGRLSAEGSTIDDLDLAQLVDAVKITLPMLDQTLGLVWRRHLASAAQRAVLAVGTEEADTHTAVVGFADLVEFTELTEQLNEAELAAAMDRFDDLAYDTVSALGGRVIKMIGDEVMFAAPNVECAAAIAWRLIDLCDVDESLTTLRAGFASGPAIDQDGDLIGPAVNLAHRLASLANPGTVLAPADLAPEPEPDDAAEGATGDTDADATDADEEAAKLPSEPGSTTGFAWSPLRLAREVRGIGQLKLATVRPEVHVPSPASPAEVEQLSDVAGRAFANVPIEALGGWSMRVAGGGRRRANSVDTHGLPGLEIDDALRIVRERYAQLELPARVIVSPLSDPEGLDEALAERGWQIEAPTVVMVGDLREIRNRCERRAKVPLVSHHRPFPSWLVGFDDLAGDTSEADLSIMYGAAERSPIVEPGLGTLQRDLPKPGAPLALGRRRFAAALEPDDNPEGDVETQAVGAGIVDGPWLGVFSMWTRTARRRRGLAAAVLSELAAWGTRAGCRLAYLQVEESNKTGRSVYGKLGFTEAYRYHYRTEPEEDAQ
jgi:adenylate cyclase